MESIKTHFKASGVNFIIFTEHEDELEDDQIESFVSKCESLSEKNLILIPGIEFRCGDIEILGLNIKTNLNYSNLEELIRCIKNKGGLAILAHPNKHRSNYNLSSLRELNGLEIWNNKYDGSRSPRIKNIELIKNIGESNIFAYAGLDFHDFMDEMQLYHQLYLDELNCQEIIKELRKGNYIITKGQTRINSRANIKRAEYIEFLFLNYVYDFFKILLFLGENFFRYFKLHPPKMIIRIIRKL